MLVLPTLTAPMSISEPGVSANLNRFVGGYDGSASVGPAVDFRPHVVAAAGETVVVDEKMMDAVTAVSGSGPAYFFYLVEAMIAAGVAEGLTP